MSDLIDTTEMYLKTIFELEEDGVTPLRARIVERLGHSGPTVSQTVGRMERDGLVHVMGDRRLELTDLGREKAVEVVRKHRLAERLLTDVIGLDWACTHEEACRWEHVMSDQVEKRLGEILNNPTTDPYGNPIPGTDATSTGISMELALRMGGANSAVVTRIGEPIQAETELLADFARLGVLPGAEIAFEADTRQVLLEVTRAADGSSVTQTGAVQLPLALSPHLFVDLN